MSTPLHQQRSRVPRFAEAAVERARLTVVPRRATAAPRVPFVTLVTVLLVGGIAGLLAFNTNLQQASFVASSLEHRAAVLTGKEESLRMQLHRLREPQHLAARAKRLGMVPSTNPAFLRLEDGAVLGSPTAAEPGKGFRISPLPPVRPRPELVVLDTPPAAADTAARPGRASRHRGGEGRTKNRDSGGRAKPARGRNR